jgi:hypothetical protein
MTDTVEPYIKHVAGDPITADDWNGIQVDVKQDIAAQIQATKQDIKTTGVDHAGDSDKFAGKSDTQWEQTLDQRYAAKNHDHEGQSVYRRYIKQFTPDVNRVLLQHRLGRYPIVDTYELLPVTTRVDGTEDFTHCKLLFFNGHADADRFDLRTRAYRDRAIRGLVFERVLLQLGVAYTDESSIADVVNDMWDAFMHDPNDEIEHCQTQWVNDCCERERTVADLRRSGEWDDLYLSLWPRKCGIGADLELGAAITNQSPAAGVVPPSCRVEIHQVNYDTLYIAADGHWAPDPSDPAGQRKLPLDLMLLLRI